MKVSCDILTVVKVRFPLSLKKEVFFKKYIYHFFSLSFYKGVKTNSKDLLCDRVTQTCITITNVVDQMYFLVVMLFEPTLGTAYSPQLASWIILKHKNLILWYCIYIQLIKSITTSQLDLCTI